MPVAVARQLVALFDDASDNLRVTFGDPAKREKGRLCAVIVEHLGDAYWQAGRRFQARYTWRAAALLAEADMAARIEAKLRDGLSAATTAP